MFTGPKIFVITFWRSVLYIICVLLIFFTLIDTKPPATLLLSILNVFTLLTLTSLFFSLITILKSIREKKAVLISFVLYPVYILLTSLNAYVFKLARLGSFAVIIGGLTILITLNMLIQTFRMRRSHITTYYRVVAITLFIIPFNTIVFPIIFAFIYKSDNDGLNALKVLSFINLALSFAVPAAIILMVRKLKRIMVIPNQIPKQ
jgi:hypothetical protein